MTYFQFIFYTFYFQQPTQLQQPTTQPNPTLTNQPTKPTNQQNQLTNKAINKNKFF